MTYPLSNRGRGIAAAARSTVRRALVPLAVLAMMLPAVCLSTAAQHSTRAEEIQAQREKKKAEVQPEQNAPAEKVLNAMKEKRVLERITEGYRGINVVFGGLATGQGFAMGPRYKRDYLADGNLALRLSARGSVAHAYMMDAEFALPRLANDHLHLGVFAQNRNFPRIGYYGPGPDSLKSNRTHYRLEDVLVEGQFIVKPTRRLNLGVASGLLRVNTGPGNYAGTLARTEDVFTPAQAPGIDNQTSFLRHTAFVEFNYLDNPGGPRSGGYYVARFTYFDDRDLKLHDFRQLHLEAQQYIPFFNARRVIALRARTVMSMENGTASVPFYLQPSLGGPYDLRGFRAYRFHDDNHIAVNVEYRWESFTGLEMAIFADGGKVTPKRSQINFHDLESSVGFGLRFNLRNNVFMRIDTGFSHEGFQVWLKFSGPFEEKR